jgi:uncharacterized protein YjiS (DUF1127 family)
MTLHTRDTASNFETETIKGPVRFHDWIDYRGLTPDQRKRLMQHVIRDARAARTLGGTGLCALQTAAGGGTAVMRALAKAVIAAAGKWWRSYAIQRAHIAAIRELHALDDRTLSDIGVSRSEIEWVVIHGRDAPRFHWSLTAKQPHLGGQVASSWPDFATPWQRRTNVWRRITSPEILDASMSRSMVS